MHFEKITTAALLVLTLTACGTPLDDDEETGIVGRKPELYSAAYLWRAGNPNLVASFDREGMTLQKFSLEPFEHLRSIPLPLGHDRQGIVASADGAYYVTIGETQFAIVRDDGSFTVNPVELLGVINGVAYDPDSNIIVLTDEFQSAAIVKLDAAGNVAGATKLGPYNPERSTLAGTILSGGRLVIALADDTKLYVYDAQASLDAGSWVSLTPNGIPVDDEATAMSWIASVPDQPDVVIVAEETRLIAMNVATETKVDEEDLSDTQVRGYFLDYYPHVLTQTSGQSADSIAQVTYLDGNGQFASKTLRSSNKRATHTWLDLASDLFTVAFDPGSDYFSSYDEDAIYRTHDLYRFRVSDSLALDRTEIGDSVSLVATPTWAFMLYPSTLGKATRRTYGRTGEAQTVEGYNLDLVRDRFKD